MITYTVKIIDNHDRVHASHNHVSDIALYGKDIQLLFPDGSETNERINHKQRIEVHPE